ncbi:hypothetical protein [Neogemmobacter tilapiae]|nr:hypothetical protein [Gemmobacter tilapiae]
MTDYSQMADRLAEALASKLRLKGASLGEKLRRGQRLLPRKVREAAALIDRAAALEGHPKLAVQIDDAKVQAAYDLCMKHLKAVNPWEKRKDLLISTGLAVVGALVVTALVTGSLLGWRGFL